MKRRLRRACLLLALLAGGCSQTTVVERVTQIVTPDVSEVTREVTREITREVTVEVTVLATRIRREMTVVTATPLPIPDRLSEAAAFQAALRWIIEQQRVSGGFSGVRETAWAVLALHAAGLDPKTVATEQDRNPVDYLEQMIEENLVAGPESAALVTLALRAAGREAPDALRLDTAPYPEAWPALPLTVIALGKRAPEDMVAALEENETEDIAQAAWHIMALEAAGTDEDAIGALLDVLRKAQHEDGRWEDAATAALAIQALTASGEDMLDWNRPGYALLALQDEDGSFGGEMTTTAAALVALHEKWLASP